MRAKRGRGVLTFDPTAPAFSEGIPACSLVRGWAKSRVPRHRQVALWVSRARLRRWSVRHPTTPAFSQARA
eukprot:7260775-Lingulodinium_polyedra.AAC.1